MLKRKGFSKGCSAWEVLGKKLALFYCVADTGSRVESLRESSEQPNALKFSCYSHFIDKETKSKMSSVLRRPPCHQGAELERGTTECESFLKSVLLSTLQQLLHLLLLHPTSSLPPKPAPDPRAVVQTDCVLGMTCYIPSNIYRWSRKPDKGKMTHPRPLNIFKLNLQVKFQATNLCFHHQAMVLSFSAAGRTWQRMANKHISKLSACNVSVITPAGDADLLLPLS